MIRIEHPFGVYGAEDGLVYLVWKTTPDREHLRKANDFVASLSEHSKRAVVTIMEQGVQNPPADIREETEKGIRKNQQNVKGVAIVIASGGFRAAIMRSVMISIQMVTKFPSPVSVFSTVEPAVDWAIERLGTTSVNRTVALKAIETARARVV